LSIAILQLNTDSK